MCWTIISHKLDHDVRTIITPCHAEPEKSFVNPYGIPKLCVCGPDPTIHSALRCEWHDCCRSCSRLVRCAVQEPCETPVKYHKYEPARRDNPSDDRCFGSEQEGWHPLPVLDEKLGSPNLVRSSLRPEVINARGWLVSEMTVLTFVLAAAFDSRIDVILVRAWARMPEEWDALVEKAKKLELAEDKFDRDLKRVRESFASIVDVLEMSLGPDGVGRLVFPDGVGQWDWDGRQIISTIMDDVFEVHAPLEYT
jgi:hypothetical protein